MSQRIEAPTEADVDRIARQLIHASDLAKSILGEELCGHESDLNLIQRILDSRQLEREATYSLQALGMAFGKVFVENNADFDWWMVEDEYGRDPAVRYKQTSLLAFPMTMISKRVEDGEPVEVRSLYSGLQQRLEALRSQGHA
jgi:hypothetical protein